MHTNAVTLYPGRDSNSYSTLVLADFESATNRPQSPEYIPLHGKHHARLPRLGQNRPAKTASDSCVDSYRCGFFPSSGVSRCGTCGGPLDGVHCPECGYSQWGRQ